MSLIVEDGSIVTGANSYVSVADADAYLRLRARATTWDTLAPAVKTGRLIQASGYLDATVSWRGDPVSDSQPMQWPRTDATDRNGTLIDDDVVPDAVVNATIEIAMIGEITTEATRVTTEETVGEISVKYQYGDVVQGVGRYKYALALLVGLTRGGSFNAVVARA